MRKIIVWLIAALLFGCAPVPSGKFPQIPDKDQDKQLVIWVLSDIQPPTVRQRPVFEKAIADVATNIGHVDLGIIAGDLLTSRSKAGDFHWFLETRKKANVLDWFQIAGNHDVRSGEVFYQFFPQSEYFAVELGNLLLLFMSDQSTASQTKISDEVFEWWKEMVEENQDRILMTVTHAQLKGSGLMGSNLSSRRINESERFEAVLKTHKVAVWFSGHSHLPHSLSGTVRRVEKFGGIYFVNVSSISDESFLDSESRFIYLENGSDTLWMRSRNHSRKSFNENLDIPIKLSQPFSWDGGRPKLLQD